MWLHHVGKQKEEGPAFTAHVLYGAARGVFRSLVLVLLTLWGTNVPKWLFKSEIPYIVGTNQQ